MISTVTTSTVSTVTTAAIAASVTLVGALVLLVLLIQKEMTSAATEGRTLNLGRALNIGILPLFIAFALSIVSRILQVLGR